MSRISKKPKDPVAYMKWRDDMIRKHGREVFESFDVFLPDEYETLKGSERDAIDNQVAELIRSLNMEYRWQNEDFIAENELDSFIRNEDWEALNSDEPMSSAVHHFKMFSGKNYSLEFVRQDEQIFFHLYYPAPIIVARNDVYDRLEEIMSMIIPRHWRVIMSLDVKVMPHDVKRSSGDLGDYPTCSSYSIHFKDGALMENALHYINRAMKAILKDFLMPPHSITA